MRWSILLAFVVFGCASAGVDNPGSGNPDASTGQDGSNPPIEDAPMVEIDAPAEPVMATLSQTTNMTIAAANSVTCSNNTTGESRDNSWYRVFALSEHGITGKPFNITGVTFAMQESAGNVQVQVKIGTYAGAIGGSTIDTAQITPLNSTTATVPPTAVGVTVDAPITATIPANGQFVVEILSPDLEGTGNHNFIGASNGGQTHPGYIRSDACTLPTPQDLATVGTGFPNSHIIITVTGTH